MDKKDIQPPVPGDMPRERLLRLGPAALSEVELLAILLRTGVAGQPVLTFSARLLASRGGLVGLLTSRKEHLLPIKGLGKAKIAELLAVTELCKRYLGANLALPDWRFRTADDVRDFLLMHYKGLAYEELAILLLDQRHRFRAYLQLSRGSAAKVALPLRRIAASVIEYDAAAVIMVHNHPARSRKPSQADRQTTARLEAFLRELEVRLLDHFIVVGNDLVSLRESGGW